MSRHVIHRHVWTTAVHRVGYPLGSFVVVVAVALSMGRGSTLCGNLINTYI